MRRRFVLLLIAVSAIGVIINTGGFSTGTIDRNVTAHVTDDADAMLGVVATDRTVTGDESDVALITLTNRRTRALTTVTVTVIEANRTRAPGLANVSTIGSLDPGESKSVTADIACQGTTNGEQITFDVTASGQTLDIYLTRQIEVRCTSPSG